METEILYKILSEKIISKKTIIANAETENMILENIKNNYVEDNLRVFKETTDTDEIIDVYMHWKKSLLAIIETDVTTENYSYKNYFCCFLQDDPLSNCFMYIMYEGKLIDIT